ncbi:hypothetical protein [Xanthomonas phage RTH11]|nr:hypothetical protein [Xanthomonas phage RTH11]
MTAATATKKNDSATAQPEIKISETVKSLSDVFAKSMKVEKDGTVVIEGDLVNDNLPTDLDAATIKRVQKHRGEVVAAATLALAQHGMKHLGKNKDADKVSVQFKIGQDKVDLAFERSREFNDGKGGKVTKHGYVSLGYTAAGATNTGDFKKAREQISREAAEIFG